MKEVGKKRADGATDAANTAADNLSTGERKKCMIKAKKIGKSKTFCKNADVLGKSFKKMKPVDFFYAKEDWEKRRHSVRMRMFLERALRK